MPTIAQSIPTTTSKQTHSCTVAVRPVALFLLSAFGFLGEGYNVYYRALLLLDLKRFKWAWVHCERLKERFDSACGPITKRAGPVVPGHLLPLPCLDPHDTNHDRNTPRNPLACLTEQLYSPLTLSCFRNCENEEVFTCAFNSSFYSGTLKQF